MAVATGMGDDSRGQKTGSEKSAKNVHLERF